MVARVLMDSTRLAVSKAGDNVLTATEDRLLLSTGSRIGQIIQRGIMTPALQSTSGGVETYTATVTFPTRAQPPDMEIFVHFKNMTTGAWSFSPNRGETRYVLVGTPSSGYFYLPYVVPAVALQTVVAGTSSLAVTIQINMQSNYIYGFVHNDIQFAYFIYRKPTFS